MKVSLFTTLQAMLCAALCCMGSCAPRAGEAPDLVRREGCLARDPTKVFDVHARLPSKLIEKPCDAPAYADAVRTRVAALLEPFPQTPLAIELGLRTVDEDGLVHQDVHFTTVDGLRAPAVLLRPNDDVARPAILLLHGHDSSHDYFTTTRTERGWGLGRELARRGFVVLAPDLRSFGAFVVDGKPHAGQNGYMHDVAKRGDVWARLAVNDARSALRVLRELEGVDAAKLGIGGVSVGGWLSWVTAVVEPDVRATVIANMFVGFERLYTKQHESCQHIRGIPDVVTAPELGFAILPRDLQIFWGADDPFYLPHDGKGTSASLAALAGRAGYTAHLEVKVEPNLGHLMDLPTQARFYEASLEPPALPTR